MGFTIHRERVDQAAAQALAALCPFGAISWQDNRLEIGSGCRACMLCVKKGPKGAITWEDEAAPKESAELWRGVAVFAELRGGGFIRFPPSFWQGAVLAGGNGEPVCAILTEAAREPRGELLVCGADRVMSTSIRPSSTLRFHPSRRFRGFYCARQALLRAGGRHGPWPLACPQGGRALPQRPDRGLHRP